MLKSLTINNFRRFQSFELKQLGRINLLVGENNSGKTSVLEAIRLLYSTADLTPLKEQLLHRGEVFPRDESKTESDLNICHLFHGHNLNDDTILSIIALQENGLADSFIINPNSSFIDQKFDGRTVYLPADRFYQNFESIPHQIHGKYQPSSINFVKLIFSWTPRLDINLPVEVNSERPGKEVDQPVNQQKESIVTELLPNQGILRETLRSYREFDDNHDVRIQWISSNALSSNDLIKMFNRIILTPEEAFISDSLKIIEPTIQRVAPSGTHSNEAGNSHGGFLVLKNGTSQPVPIGSLGDGIWRCLGLALAIVNARGGILLVDEIDTGLHFSTMKGAWEMVLKTAKRLNVQVFATTHSRDCWESLAEVAEVEDAKDNEILIHRIEKGKSESVTFNPQQMGIAAERGIEVR